MKLDPSIRKLREAELRMSALSASFLRRSRMWLAAGDLKKAVEHWGTANLLHGAAGRHHDRLLTKASARIRDDLMAALP